MTRTLINSGYICANCCNEECMELIGEDYTCQYCHISFEKEDFDAYQKQKKEQAEEFD